jgi:hypothetical protein
MIEKFIDEGCKKTDDSIMFKSYFFKDEFNCLTIIDNECSIKCVFDIDFLSKYLNNLPSYVKVENFENAMVLIKKCYFDLHFSKNINKTLSIRVILYIKDFEVDFGQKSMGNYKRANVNGFKKIQKRLKDFYNNYTFTDLRKNFKPVHLDAKNFITNTYPELDNSTSKNGSFYKILKHDVDNWLMNTDLILDEKRNFIIEIQPGCDEFAQVIDINEMKFYQIFIKPPQEGSLIGKKVERNEVKEKYLEE